MLHRLTRRGLVGVGASLFAANRLRTALAAAAAVAFSYPVVWPGKRPGEGFFVKHGYACENAINYPGLSHTGENWYGNGANAAGASVIAAAAGTVVYADYDYPGHVTIVQHAPALYSMYGHMAYELDVAVGDVVHRGQSLGRILDYPGDTERSHLHFEFRTFLYEDVVNGDHPSYGFTCGYECAPGPGYWPLTAPEHPSDLGWRNPTHVIAHRMLAHGAKAAAIDALVTDDAPHDPAPLWSSPPWRADAEKTGSVDLKAGDRLPLLQIAAGAEAARDRDARGYLVWYRVELPDARRGWLQAVVAATDAVNADGAPASVRLPLIPAVGR
jgi:murein DD-endopeptidase MepM/ murein hydrolase activator NlpD